MSLVRAGDHNAVRRRHERWDTIVERTVVAHVKEPVLLSLDDAFFIFRQVLRLCILIQLAHFIGI